MVAILMMIAGATAHVTAQATMTGVLEHPCVLLTAETLPAIKANAAAMEDNQFGFATGDAWAEIKQKADRFLEAEPYHYRVTIPAKDDKEQMVWEYTLSDENPPLHDERPSYPPWTAMFQERADSITTRIKYLSFAYLVTGERKYAGRAKTIVMHLTNWDQWTDPSYTAGVTKACLDTGHCTKCVGFFYDWCYDTLSDSERATIREAIAGKGILPSREDVDRYPAATNGFAVITSGIVCAAIAIRPEEARAGEWLQAGLEKTAHSFDLGGSDGGAFEGPGYGTYLLDSFANVLDAVTAAQVDNDLFDHPFLATMDRYCISQLTPDGRVMPNFSDGSPVAGYPETMAILAHRGSTAAAWYLEQAGLLNVDTLYRFIRFDASKLDPQPPTFDASQAFVDIGYASLRDGYARHTPYLAFKSGPPENNIGHNHYDHNSFQLSYLGEFLVADRGYRHRFIPIKTKFTRGTIGHSSLVLDITDEYLASATNPDLGHDQIHRTGGRIEQFFTTPALDFIQGQAAPAYNNDETTVVEDFTRRIIYFKPWAYVMLDRVRTPEPHTMHLCLQLAPQAQSKQIAPHQWNINNMRAQLACWFHSPDPITVSTQLYPGAEEYGEYLTVSSEARTEAEFMTLMYPRTRASEGLIPNAGFEESYRGWQIRSNQDAPNHVIDHEIKRSGESSGRIDGSGYYYSAKLPVDPGELVKASVWMKTEGAANGGNLILYWWREGKSIGNESSGARNPADWEKVDVEGVAPKGADQVCMACTFHDTGRVWYDAAEMWLESPPEILAIKRPEPEVVEFADDGAGLTFVIDGERFVLVKGGDPARFEEHTVGTDGTLACIAQSGYVYLQEGTSITLDGEVMLTTDRPLTVCVWSGDVGVVHVLAQDDLTPHAPPLAPEDIRVTMASATPITEAYTGDAKLKITDNGDGTFTLGGLL